MCTDTRQIIQFQVIFQNIWRVEGWGPHSTMDRIHALHLAALAWIFDVEGEESFRKREAAIIQELTQHKGIVLATG